MGPARVRQCDLMADIVAAQIRGTDEFGGDMTAIHPLILRARPRHSHPMWTDAVLEDGQTIAFELGGCRKRYNVGLARTIHIGTPPQKLQDTAKAVEEGMQAVMDNLHAGAITGDVHAAWQRVLDRYGLKRKAVSAIRSVLLMPQIGGNILLAFVHKKPRWCQKMRWYISSLACGWTDGAWS